jgi:nucleoside-diphosphate-sugar epimerase
MKIMITGSSGTIGTRLCEMLLDKGYEVIGVDWKPNKWNEDINKITTICDLRRKEELEKIPTDIDLIIHLAANARVYNLVVDPDLALDNILTTYNTLEFARKNNIKKVMFASSREVYGNTEIEILKETDADIDHCESPYTASKITGEALVRAYKQCYGIDFVLFRFSNVYGMYDESDRVIPLFIRLCKANKDLTVFGKDKMLDFTYIDDTVTGIIQCIQQFNEIKNQTYNLAYGEGTSLVELAELIKKELGTNNEIIIAENRTGEVVKYIADINKAKRKIGYMPKTNIEEGVKKSIDWYKEHL